MLRYVGFALFTLTIVLLVWLVCSDSGYHTDEKGKEMIRRVRIMFRDVYPEKQNIPIKEGDESYAMNKSSITLCLRNPTTGQMYSWNTIAYVALHELAHIITLEKEQDDHGPIFSSNLTKLLKKAHALRYYDPFQEIPDTYCSTN